MDEQAADRPVGATLDADLEPAARDGRRDVHAHVLGVIASTGQAGPRTTGPCDRTIMPSPSRVMVRRAPVSSLIWVPGRSSGSAAPRATREASHQILPRQPGCGDAAVLVEQAIQHAMRQ